MHYLELILIAIIVVYPLVDFVNEKFKSSSKNIEYIKIASFLWSLTIFLFYIYSTNQLSVISLDFAITMNWQNMVAFSLILVAIVYLIFLIRSIISNETLRQEVATKFEPYLELMPTTKTQILLFTLVLSVSAGICEEIIFRAYLFNVIDSHIGMAGAIILSSLIFGLWHVYLGWQEVIRTSIMGAILCGVYLFTGNIIVPIVLHIFIDIYSGLICYFAVREQPTIQQQDV